MFIGIRLLRTNLPRIKGLNPGLIGCSIRVSKQLLGSTVKTPPQVRFILWMVAKSTSHHPRNPEKLPVFVGIYVGGNRLRNQRVSEGCVKRMSQFHPPVLVRWNPRVSQLLTWPKEKEKLRGSVAPSPFFFFFFPTFFWVGCPTENPVQAQKKNGSHSPFCFQGH